MPTWVASLLAIASGLLPARVLLAVARCSGQKYSMVVTEHDVRVASSEGNEIRIPATVRFRSAPQGTEIRAVGEASAVSASQALSQGLDAADAWQAVLIHAVQLARSRAGSCWWKADQVFVSIEAADPDGSIAKALDRARRAVRGVRFERRES